MMDAFFKNSERTGDVIVRAEVSYLAAQSNPDQDMWFWSYHIRLENVGDDAVQLLSRHWDIVDGRGAQQVVDGPGVVGETPVILPGDAFDYVSGCPLSTPTGSMAGFYRMVDAGGEDFEVKIPHLLLRAPVTAA
jgi:ApaG protein